MKVNIIVLFIVTTLYDGQFHFYQGAANAHLGLIRGLNGNAGLSVTADLSKPRRILGGIFSHLGNELSSGGGIQASANIELGSGGSGNNDYGFGREYQNSIPNEYQWRPENSYSGSGDFRTDITQSHHLGINSHELGTQYHPLPPNENQRRPESFYSGSGDFRADLTQTHQVGNYPHGLGTQYQPPPPYEHQWSNEITYPSSIDFDIDRTHSHRIGNYPHSHRREQQRSPSHKHHRNRENSYSNTGDFDTDLTLTSSTRDHNRVSGHRRYPHLSDLQLPVIILNDEDSTTDKTKPNEIEGIVNQIEQTGNELIKAGEITESAFSNYSRGFRKDDQNTPPKEQRKNYESLPSANFNVHLTHSHEIDDHDKPNGNHDHRHHFKLPDLPKLSSPKMSVLTSGRAYFSKDEMKQAKIEPPRMSGGRILGEYVSQMGHELRKAGILKETANDNYLNNREKENQRLQWNKNQQNPENVDSSPNDLGADLEANLTLSRPIGNVNGNDRNSKTRHLKLPNQPDQSSPKMSILTSSRTDTSQDKIDYDDNESTKKTSGTFLGGIVSRIGNKLRGDGGDQASTDGKISNDHSKDNHPSPETVDSGSSHFKADLGADLTLSRPIGNVRGRDKNSETRQDLNFPDLPDLSSSRMPASTSGRAEISRDKADYDDNESTKKTSGTFLGGIVNRIGNKLRGAGGDQASTDGNISHDRHQDNQRNPETVDSGSTHFKADLGADLTLSRPIGNVSGRDKNSETRQDLNFPDLPDLSSSRMPASTSVRAENSRDKADYDDNESTKKTSGTFLGGIVSRIGNKLRGAGGDQASTVGNISNDHSKDNHRSPETVDSGSSHLKADLEPDLTRSRASNKANRNYVSEPSRAEISKDLTKINESEASRKTGGRFLGRIVNRIGNKLSGTGGIHASASLTIGAGSEESENASSTHDEPQHKLRISKVFNAFI